MSQISPHPNPTNCPQSELQEREPTRPRILLLVLLGFAVSQVWRAQIAWQQAQMLVDLPTALSPWYGVVTSAAWALIFATTLLMVWRHVRFAAVAAILAVVLNQAHVWLDRLLFSRSTESMQTLGFAALLSALLIIVVSLPSAHFHINHNGNN